MVTEMITKNYIFVHNKNKNKNIFMEIWTKSNI